MPYKDPERQRQYQRERNAAVRAAWLASNGPCRCGSWDRLEVDHIDPATKIAHTVWSWSEARRAVELAKCQVLCYGCHKEKTRGELSRPPEHGTATEYRNGCRCEPCGEAQKAAMKIWRAARKCARGGMADAPA